MISLTHTFVQLLPRCILDSSRKTCHVVRFIVSSSLRTIHTSGGRRYDTRVHFSVDLFASVTIAAGCMKKLPLSLGRL